MESHLMFEPNSFLSDRLLYLSSCIEIEEGSTLLATPRNLTILQQSRPGTANELSLDILGGISARQIPQDMLVTHRCECFVELVEGWDDRRHIFELAL
jgi:hypothetical protein